jgi:hypothetical protein
MWINNLRFLSIKVKMKEPRKFHLSLPISLIVFHEILDSTNDLLTLLCVFIPRRKSNSNSVSIAKQVVQVLNAFFLEIKEEKPFDLVDVSTEQVSVTISYK